MDTTLDQEKNAKNIYVIRRKLSILKKVPGRSHYEYRVGNFVLSIFTHAIQDEPDDGLGCLLKHQTVSINLEELNKSGVSSYIYIWNDSRFKNYEPIQYNVVKTPNGLVNLSDGLDMPILHLCELIRYLHRLSNLTAFL